MTGQAFEHEKLYQGKFELAAAMENGMIMFKDNTVPERFSDADIDYLKNSEAIDKEIQEIRLQGEMLKQQYGDFHGKAYMAGMLGKIAGGVGNVVDFYELGRRANTAYDSGNDSDWDAVTGQLAKMASNAAGGVASLGVARLTGVILAGISLPSVVVIGGAVLAGGVATYYISKLADYAEEEISKGKNPFDFKNENFSNVEASIVGDIDYSKYGEDTLIKADKLTLIGSQRFKNLEIQSKSLHLIGDLHSDEKMIINSEEITQSKLEDLAQANLNAHPTTQPELIETPKEAGQSLVELNIRASEAVEDTAIPDILESRPELDLDTYLRLMEGTASREDVVKMALYEEWLSKQEAMYSNPLSQQPIMPEIASGALIQ